MRLTLLPSWQKLHAHYDANKNIQLQELFASNPRRFEEFSTSCYGLFMDYSKQKLNTETLSLLIELAEETKLTEHIDQMFTGKPINTTEQRAVLHTALRDPEQHPEVAEVLTKMANCVDKIRSGAWVGYSGEKITDIVNIGIGGSDLGPAMVTKAITPYTSATLHCHFVSNVDGTHITETLKYLNPETTLFIIASKTFATQETLCNANTAKEWLEQKATSKQAIKQHLLAVTAKPERAIAFGISEQHIFPFWDWVGGRYSLWSAIGLPIALAIGMDNFYKLLAGAKAMDEHFRTSPFAKNLPVLAALIGIWNINFLNMQSLAVLPYDQYLALLPAYLQQLEMESNGKSVNLEGNKIDYNTAPIVWGAAGTNGQHAFHQLLMQGTQQVPIDFILPLKSHNSIGQHHLLLTANCFAQSQALMQGRSEEQITAELKEDGLTEKEAKKLAPHKVITGNNPSTTILIEKITPQTLGALIAFYEHKVFTQGVIWNINSFDQWGVELGKKLTNNIVPVLQDGKSAANLDSSTRGLIEKHLT